MTALNALKVMAADIMNVYIIAPKKEKIWIPFGTEVGRDNGHKAIVERHSEDTLVTV